MWRAQENSRNKYFRHRTTFEISAGIIDKAASATARKAKSVARLDAEIEKPGDGTGALTSEAKAARVADIEGGPIGLQHEAEAIADYLASQDQPVRRSCADPQILLGAAQARS